MIQDFSQAKFEQLHPVVSRLLQKRGLDQDAMREFFSWDLKTLPDFSQLKDIHKTALRLIEAVNKNEKIGIYGDYDVDGTTSCALFYHFFKMLDVEIDLIQPSRFIEGYGIHPPSIDRSVEQGIKVLVSVDCGITNVETAEYALTQPLDLIITDHHKDIREVMPPAYSIVNPNRRDEDLESPMVALAGVGVAFAVCVEMRKIMMDAGKEVPSLYPLLQFVAIGTISDLANLNSMNKKLVRHGLKQIPKTQYPGIKVFLTQEEQKMDMIPSEKISFFIGPMINSKGRLDHPEVALKALIAPDHETAYPNFNILETSNNERKSIQKDVFEEAKAQVLKNIKSDDAVITIVYAPHWHEGVIGIVASKLVETFKAPAIVFTDAKEEGIIKASARSAGDLNLFKLLEESKDFFLKFGGHKAAAGLSMKKEKFEDFKKFITTNLAKVPEFERTVIDSYDLTININEIDATLVKQLETLEPFGMGNERPLFNVHDSQLVSFDLLKDIHVKWHFKSKKDNKKISGISFSYIDKWGAPPPEKVFNLQEKEGINIRCTIGINRFRGNEYIQLMVNKILLGNA